MRRAESRLAGEGTTVAGVDEAGRGPLAGPGVAAAVVLDRLGRWAGLIDSKQMTADVRDRMFGSCLAQPRGVCRPV